MNKDRSNKIRGGGGVGPSHPHACSALTSLAYSTPFFSPSAAPVWAVVCRGKGCKDMAQGGDLLSKG
eukprot:CAMPEP_0117687700 /NCGR_PEP_ID=MMETSP0804-20121206/23306_1 /TAXON_ID=1074897 /ORGANISM="Tetraselmis astigmatica, Strain CCMP880" /LENGTH=66 /DNA_ID=CAMNT_0005499843 /DNA_START=76 /DNA_END=273 /DNA_ORIENTATION=-